MGSVASPWQEGSPTIVTTSSLYERLRSAILNGEFRPGAVLAETALAETHGVSRTPIREALRRLEQDGVIERNGRQLTVRVTTPEEVLEIYDCRIVLEGMAAEWAARMRSDYDLALMDRALNRMVSLQDATPSEMSSTNHVFHDCLWRASHNSTLFDLLERLEVHIRRYPQPTVSQPGRWGEAVQEHEGILDAVRVRDAERARQLSIDHMTTARDLRLAMIRQGHD
jgi:DNA-binding GntR family transcriptional regulator